MWRPASGDLSDVCIHSEIGELIFRISRILNCNMLTMNCGGRWRHFSAMSVTNRGIISWISLSSKCFHKITIVCVTRNHVLIFWNSSAMLSGNWDEHTLGVVAAILTSRLQFSSEGILELNWAAREIKHTREVRSGFVILTVSTTSHLSLRPLIA